MRWDDVLDDARADGLAQGRMRERWLLRQAAESATLLGTLLDLAESGTDVSVAVAGGRRHDGRPVGLGSDVLVLADRGEHVVVRLGAVTVVRPSPGGGSSVAAGDRPAALDLGLVELLARLSGEEPEVAVALVSGDLVAGALLAVGADVLSLRVAPGADGIVYCSAAAVSSVRFRSG